VSGKGDSYFDLVVPRAYTDDSVAIVRPGSRRTLRRAVEGMARLFQREGRYDFLSYQGDDPGHSLAVLFSADYFRWLTRPRVWVAACCFYYERSADCLPSWSLGWVWCHPYLRGGFEPFLPRAWQDLCKIIDAPFFVDPPLTPPMRHGLLNMGYRPNKRGFFLCGKGFPPAIADTVSGEGAA
jgi:hypothetical protein